MQMVKDLIPMFNRQFLLFCILLIGSKVCSQDFHYTNYNYTHGLNLNNASKFALDSSGYLWMGSPSGLVRFDGNEFESYFPDSGDSTSIPSTYV